MRVAVGKTLRVGRGDKVTITGRLPTTAKLGRLFVFASENGAQFSPYVPHVADMLVDGGKPAMLSPLSLRLVTTVPERKISFDVEIDGFIRVMQEIDTPQDTKAKVSLTRKVNPDLGWIEWAQRKLTSWQTPKLSS